MDREASAYASAWANELANTVEDAKALERRLFGEDGGGGGARARELETEEDENEKMEVDRGKTKKSQAKSQHEVVTLVTVAQLLIVMTHQTLLVANTVL